MRNLYVILSLTILTFLYVACQKKKSTTPFVTPPVDSTKKADTPVQIITYPNIAKYTGILLQTSNLYYPSGDLCETSKVSDTLSFYVTNLNSVSVVITSSKSVFLMYQNTPQFINDTITNSIYIDGYIYFTDSCSFQIQNGCLSINWDNEMRAFNSITGTTDDNTYEIIGQFKGYLK